MEQKLKTDFDKLISTCNFSNQEIELKKISLDNFLKNGFIGISAMHLTGIFYSFLQILFHSKFNIFLYNLGKYSVGKIGYHFLMLLPLLILIKPIKHLKYRK